MLNNVTAWVEARPDTRMDSRAFLACMFDLKIDSSNDTMFRACWNLATIPGQAGAATEAVVEAAKKEEVTISVWYDHCSHVRAYYKARGIARRAAAAIRHDLRRIFSPRFF